MANKYRRETVERLCSEIAELKAENERYKLALESIADMTGLYYLSSQHALGSAISTAKEALKYASE